MPNISIAELARLRRCEAQLKAREESKAIAPFAEQLCQNLGLVVANMARERWPSWVVGCVEDAARKYPVGAHFWEQHRSPIH
jgi:hypothetical protein